MSDALYFIAVLAIFIMAGGGSWLVQHYVLFERGWARQGIFGWLGAFGVGWIAAYSTICTGFWVLGMPQ